MRLGATSCVPKGHLAAGGVNRGCWSKKSSDPTSGAVPLTLLMAEHCGV